MIDILRGMSNITSLTKAQLEDQIERSERNINYLCETIEQHKVELKSEQEDLAELQRQLKEGEFNE